MKTKTLFLTLLSLTATLPALAQKESIPVSLHNKNLKPLGTGYNSRSETLMGVCVDNASDSGEKPPEVDNLGEATGSFDLRTEKSQSEIGAKLGITADGRYKTGATTISAAASFLQETSSSDFNLSYTFASDHSYKETLDASRKFPVRPMPGFAKIVGSKDKFYTACGDEFVQARIRAARVLVNINVSFVSKSQKEQFNAMFGVNSPIMDFKATLEKNSHSFSSGNQMTVRAYQVGGDPAKIGRILCPVNSNGEIDPNCEKNSKDVANCSFGSITDCTKLIASAIAYTNAQDGDNFPSQIAGGKNYDVTSLETEPYTTLGAPFVSPPTVQKEKEFNAAVKQISDVFDSQYKLWTYSNHLFNSKAPRLAVDQKEGMEIIQNQHFKNLSRAADSLDQCYDIGYAQCTKEVELIQDLMKLNEDEQNHAIEAITVAKEFVQFCDLGDNDHPSIQKTIATLKAYAIGKVSEAEKDRFDKGDTCANLADWMNAQKEIDLSEAGPLGDLAPIASLKNLEKLNLNRKEISSIDVLANLKNLKELSLDNNQIVDLSPLTNLKKLQRLSVQNNLITPESMATLSSLNKPTGSLVKLDGRGNQEGVKCPITAYAGCKIKSYADYSNISSASTRCGDTMEHQAIEMGDKSVLATGGLQYPQLSAKIQVVKNSGCQDAGALAFPRVGHTMTRTPQGILVVGGGTNQIELIDTTTLAPQVLPNPLAEAVTNHTATLLSDGSVVIIGGANDADALQAFDHPAGLSSFVQIVHTDGSVETIGQLAVPRSRHTATLLNDGTILVLGGFSLNGMVSIAEVVDPAKKTVSTMEKSLPVGRMNHSAVILPNGHVYVAGGAKWEEKDGKKYAVPVAEMVDFDPATKSFRVIEELLSPARSKIRAIATSDGRVLLIGGVLDSIDGTDGTKIVTSSNEVSLYDPESEGIYKVSTLLNHLVGFSATQAGENTVLIFGGQPTWSVKEGALKSEEMVSSTELLVYRPR